MKYDPQRHHRRSIRLKGYDYSQAGLYFITICTQNRAHLFGDIENGEMILNPFGKIAAEEWVNTEKVRDQVRIHDFVIMPDHIHGIIEILYTGESKFAPTEKNQFKSPSQTIGAIVRGFKIATIKKIKEFIQGNLGGISSSTGELQFAPTLDFKIWQRNYYEHIIRNETAYERIAQYIIDNPKNWGRDK